MTYDSRRADSARSAHQRQRFDEGISHLVGAGDNLHADLLRAARDCRINLLFVADRSAILPKLKLRQSRRPTLVLIADDDETPTGPEGWRCAAAACDWAAGIVVHAAGAEPWHAEALLEATEQFRCVTLIETSSRFAYAWIDLGDPGKARTLIVPFHGPHPVQQARETMQ